MSRCFPYPPPGYSRNGATYEALIESIKLQKENDKARKKEKRAKKEKKEKRKDTENSKQQKITTESHHQDFHKHLQNSDSFKQQNIKRKEPIIEQQLEKSDLTEEHGQPVDSHKPSYSSDSTQNSNKRKRDDLVEPDDSNHVKPIKIRLFKKQKEHDFIKETSCSVSGRSDPQNLLYQYPGFNGINVPLVQKTTGERKPLVSSSNRKKATSYDRKQSVPVSLQTKKSDMAVGDVSRQEPISIPSYRKPSECEIPIPPAATQKNDASSSGRSIDEMKKDVIPSKVGPSRFEKKMKKKHLKYEKLIGGWVPPVFEAQVGGGDDDWLKGSGTVKAARSSLLLRDDVETCREVTWQPCARFLVEADVYALPYAVPF